MQDELAGSRWFLASPGSSRLIALMLAIGFMFWGCETKVETTLKSPNEAAVGSDELNPSTGVRRYERDFTLPSVIENEWGRLTVPANTFSEPFAVEMRAEKASGLTEGGRTSISENVKISFSYILAPDQKPVAQNEFELALFSSIPVAPESIETLALDLSDAGGELRRVKASDLKFQPGPDGRLAAVTETNAVDFEAAMYVDNTSLEEKDVLDAPTGLTAISGIYSVNLKWNPVDGAQSYILYWANQTGVTTASNPIPLTENSYVHSQVDGTDLDPTKDYFYAVQAIGEDGNSFLSGEASARPGGAAPGKVTNFVATAQHRKVVFDWDQVEKADRYTLYVNSAANFDPSAPETIVLEDVEPGHEYSVEENGERQFFVVTASNDFGESAFSEERTAVPGSTNPTVAMEVDGAAAGEVLRTNADNISVRLRFNEPVFGLTVDDIDTFDNQSVALSEGADNVEGGTEYTVIASPTVEGLFKLQLKVDSVVDADGNPNPASNEVSINYDNSRPTGVLTAEIEEGASTNVQRQNFTLTVSETLQGLSPAVFTIKVDDSPVTDAIEDFVFSDLQASFSVSTDQGLVSVEVEANKFFDLGGNGNDAVAPYTFRYDKDAPQVVSFTAPEINGVPGATAFTNQTTINIELQFDKPVVGFAGSTARLDVTKGEITAIGEATAVGGKANTYTFPVTIDPGTTPEGLLVEFNLAAGSVSDAVGNLNLASESLSLRVDTISPQGSLTVDAGIFGLNIGSEPETPLIPFQLTLTEASVNDVESDDFSVTNGSVAGVSKVSDTEYTINVTPAKPTEATDTGFEVAISLTQLVSVVDRAGNTAQDPISATATADLVRPTVSAITAPTTVGGEDPIFQVKFTFSEPVQGFDESDLALASGSNTGFTLQPGTLSPNDGEAHTEYTIDAKVTEPGNYEIGLVDGSVEDAGGNPTLTSAEVAEVFYNDQVPKLTLALAPAEGDSPLSQTSFDLIVTFDRDIADDFVASETSIDVSGGTVTFGATSVVTPNRAYRFGVTASPGTVYDADGVEFQFVVNPNQVRDPIGNANAASDLLSVVVDTEAPVAALSVPDRVFGLDGGQTPSIPFSLELTESIVNELQVSDFSVTNGTITLVQQDLDNAKRYTIQVQPSQPQGTNGAFSVQLELDNFTTLTDAAGNQAAAGDSATAEADLVEPRVTSVTAPEKVGGENPQFTVTAYFSENVTGFDLSDVVLLAGSSAGFTKITDSVTPNDGGYHNSYSFQVELSDPGSYEIGVVTAAVTDKGSNQSLSSLESAQVEYSNENPTPSLSASVGDFTNLSSFDLTVTFDRAIASGFEASDATIDVQGGTVRFGSTTKLQGLNAYKFSVTLRPTVMDTDGIDLDFTVKPGVVDDLFGNPNVASSPLTITVDQVAPTATITAEETIFGIPSTPPLLVPFTVTFDEQLKDSLQAGNFSVNNGRIDRVVQQNLNPSIFVVQVEPVAPGGELGVFQTTLDLVNSPSAASGAPDVADRAGNVGNTGAQESIQADLRQPSVVFSGPGIIGGSAPVRARLTATFSEPVIGFDTSDVRLFSGNAADVMILAGSLTRSNPDSEDPSYYAEYSFDVELAAAGTFEFEFEPSFVATDRGDNESNLPDNRVTVRYENAKPQAAIDFFADSDLTTPLTGPTDEAFFARLTWNKKIDAATFTGCNDLTIAYSEDSGTDLCATMLGRFDADIDVSAQQITISRVQILPPETPEVGTIIFSVPGNGVEDLLGNDNIASSNSQGIDKAAPEPAISFRGFTPGDEVNNTFEVEIQFSQSYTDALSASITEDEGVANFDVNGLDVSLTKNSTVKDCISGSGTANCDISFTAESNPATGFFVVRVDPKNSELAEGTLSVSVPAGATTDATGNSSLVSNTLQTPYDRVAPQATINLDGVSSQPINRDFELIIDWNDDIDGSTFTKEDISVSFNGLSNASVGRLTQESSTRFRALVTNIPQGSGELLEVYNASVSISGGLVKDTAGNGNQAATADFPGLIDVKPPEFTVTLTNVNGRGFSDQTVTATFDFSEALDESSYTFPDSFAVSGVIPTNHVDNGQAKVFDLDPPALGSANTAVTLNAAIGANQIEDKAGNLVVPLASDKSFIFDVKAPTVDFGYDNPDDAGTEVDRIFLALQFDEPVNGLDASDFTCTNSACNISSFSLIYSEGSDNATLFVSPLQTDIEFDITYKSNSVTDVSIGRANTDSATVAVDYFNESPVPTLSLATGLSSPVDSRTFDIDLDFNKVVVLQTLDAAVLFPENTTEGINTNIDSITFLTSSPETALQSFKLRVTASTDGPVKLQFAAGNAKLDGGAQINTDSNTLNVEVDTQPPTVSIAAGADQDLPFKDAITVVATFSETIAAFPESEMVLSTDGSSTASFREGSLSVDGDGLIYEFIVDVTGADGTNDVLTVEFPAGSFADDAGNGSGESFSEAFNIDAKAPALAEAISVVPTTPTNDKFTLTANFDEPTKLTAGNIAVSPSGSISNLTNDDGGFHSSYTFEVQGGAGTSESLTVTINGGSDPTGNVMSAVNAAGLAWDQVSPTIVSVKVLDTGGSELTAPSKAGNFKLEAVFSEPVANLLASPSIVSGTGLTISNPTGLGTDTITYDITADASAVDEILQFSIPANFTADPAGNANADTMQSAQYKRDNIDPVANFTSVPSTTQNSEFDVVLEFGEEVFVSGATFSPTTHSNKLTITNGSLNSFVDQGGGTYTLKVIGQAGTTNAVTVSVDPLTDKAGNQSNSLTSDAVPWDNLRPTMDSQTGEGNPTLIQGLPQQDVLLNFSEPVTLDRNNLTITATGGTAGTPSLSPAGEAEIFTLSFTPTAGSGNVQVEVQLANNLDTVVDSAGNPITGTFPKSTFVFDPHAPVVDQFSGPSGDTRKAPVPFQVVFAEPVSQVDAQDFEISGTATVTNVQAVGGVPTATYTFELTDLAEGEIQVRAIVDGANPIIDEAGNPIASASAYSAAFTYDGTAPDFNLVIQEGEFTNGNFLNVTLTGNLRDIERVLKQVGNGVDCSGNGFQTFSGSANGQFDVTALTGVITVCFKAEDAAGNVSGVKADTITIDRDAPTLTIDNASAASVFRGVAPNNQFSGALNDTGLSGIKQVRYVIKHTGAAVNYVVLTEAPTVDGNDWEFVISQELVDADTYTLHIAVEDNAGNRSDIQTQDFIWIEDPVNVTFSINNDATYTQSTDGDLNFVDASNFYEVRTFVGAGDVTCNFNGGFDRANATDNPRDQSLGSVAEGIVTVCVQHRNQFGGTANHKDTIIYDATGPTITFDEQAQRGPNKRAKFTFDVVDAIGLGGASVEVRLKVGAQCFVAGSDPAPCSNVHYVGATAEGGVQYSFTLPAADMGAGNNYSIEVRASDNANNTTTEQSNAFEWLPALAIDFEITGQPEFTNGNTVNLTPKGDFAQWTKFEVTVVDEETACPEVFTNATAGAPPNPIEGVDVSGFENATVKVCLLAEDALNNVGGAFDTVFVDRQAPVVEIDAGASSQDLIKTQTVTDVPGSNIDFTVWPQIQLKDETGKCLLPGNTFADVPCESFIRMTDNNGNYEFDLTAFTLTDNVDYTATVKAEDKAGNTQVSAPFVFTYAPDLPVTILSVDEVIGGKIDYVLRDRLNINLDPDGKEPNVANTTVVIEGNSCGNVAVAGFKVTCDTPGGLTLGTPVPIVVTVDGTASNQFNVTFHVDQITIDRDQVVAANENNAPGQLLFDRDADPRRIDVHGTGFSAFERVLFGTQECQTVVIESGTHFHCMLPDQTVPADLDLVIERKRVAADFREREVLTVGCPRNYVYVPAPGTPDEAEVDQNFCVAKYEMKDVNNVATSQAAGKPWVNIPKGKTPATEGSAWKACRDLGDDYDLISAKQWQTVARNILEQADNWDGDAVFTGKLHAGHNDNDPAEMLEAGTRERDSLGTGSGASEQIRVHALSNGMTIWDLAGNAGEWLLEEARDNGTGDSTSGFGGTSLTDPPTIRSFVDANSRPLMLRYWAFPNRNLDSVTDDGGFGKIFVAEFSGSQPILKGGNFSSNSVAADFAGVFSTFVGGLDLDNGHEHTGFRCVYLPEGGRIDLEQLGAVTSTDGDLDQVVRLQGFAGQPFSDDAGYSNPRKVFANGDEGAPAELFGTHITGANFNDWVGQTGADKVGFELFNGNPTLNFNSGQLKLRTSAHSSFIGTIRFDYSVSIESVSDDRGASAELVHYQGHQADVRFEPAEPEKFFGFITASTKRGDHGGGNQLCEDAANDSNSVNIPVNYKWATAISTDASSVTQRLSAFFVYEATATPYLRSLHLLDGTEIVPSVADLLDATKTLRVGLSLDNEGNKLAGEVRVWTGTKEQGGTYVTEAGKTCNNWSTGGDSADGNFGNANDLTDPIKYQLSGSRGCNSQGHLYCVGRPLNLSELEAANGGE